MGAPNGGWPEGDWPEGSCSAGCGVSGGDGLRCFGVGLGGGALRETRSEAVGSGASAPGSEAVGSGASAPTGRKAAVPHAAGLGEAMGSGASASGPEAVGSSAPALTGAGCCLSMAMASRASASGSESARSGGWAPGHQCPQGSSASWALGSHGCGSQHLLHRLAFGHTDPWRNQALSLSPSFQLLQVSGNSDPWMGLSLSLSSSPYQQRLLQLAPGHSDECPSRLFPQLARFQSHCCL